MDEKKIKKTGNEWRLSSQPVMPIRLTGKEQENYRLFPHHALGDGRIFHGYASLAAWILNHPLVLIDGYIGVCWKTVKSKLEAAFHQKGIAVNWIETTDYRKDARQVDQLVQPWLGEKDTVWGTKTDLSLADFFQLDKGADPNENDHPNASIHIVLGIGAAIFHQEAPLIYLDLPKNELQYRVRAGSVYNLGTDQMEDFSQMYKRFYFVDWVVLNAHKQNILNRIAVIADAQQPEDINWMTGDHLKQGLVQLSKSVFRVRPWFEAGAWGGQWLKSHFPLNPEEVNYAWSFELITPENGLIFESEGYLLEVSFDFLMFQASANVLGNHAARYGTAFPIRFDFLDTFQGGNLSIQCHPSVKYIQEVFGEDITQDETYYILDCAKDAKVYLGFQEGIDPEEFRTVLMESQTQSKAVNIDAYVQSHPAHQHDLFLIPNGTIHSAGVNNLVLEISATPYIFTFKMYDWLRMDLGGEPRPINIEHAFNNLNFDRQGKMVQEELIAHPVKIANGEDWQLIHLPTHQEHFYDIHRLEFDTQVTMQTENVCQVMMLVEGVAISVKMADGTLATFNYGETFVIPAAADSYTLINKSQLKAKVIKAFLKNQTNDLFEVYAKSSL